MHDTLFRIINGLILIPWFCLLFFPKKKWTFQIVDATLLVLAALFCVNLAPGLAEIFPLVVNPTLDAVQAMLGTPSGTVGAWNHFVMGDLMVARWVTKDSQERKISEILVVPVLILTILFGPVGLLGYASVRAVKKLKAR